MPSMGDSDPSTDTFNDAYFSDLEKLIPDWGGADTNWTETRKKALSKIIMGLITIAKSTVKKVEVLKAENAELRELVRKKTAPAMDFSQLFKEKSSDFGAAVSAVVERNAGMLEKKNKNVMISGIEFKNDKNEDAKYMKEMVDKALTKMDVGVSAKKITRITRHSESKSTRPPLVLVEFNDATEQNKVINSARKLAEDANLKKLYISRDLTPDEQKALAMTKKKCWESNQELEHTDDQGRKYGKDKEGTEYYYGIRSGLVQTICKNGEKMGRIIKLKL